MKRAFDFATIGFRPYPETAEFTTVGVLAFEPQKQEFGFVLLHPKKTRKIKSMFPALVEGFYRDAHLTLKRELESVEDAINFGSSFTNTVQKIKLEGGEGLFAALTTPRDGIFCYPIKGRRIGESMGEVLGELRKRYIDQLNLVPPLSVEGAMAANILKILKDVGVAKQYQKDVRIGPEKYRISFSLGHLISPHRADRVIRPLNFDRKNTTEMYNHGDEWLTRLKRLQDYRFKPERCLFTMRPPQGGDKDRMEVFAQIKAEFKLADLELAEENDVTAVVKFAASDINLFGSLEKDA